MTMKSYIVAEWYFSLTLTKRYIFSSV